MAKKNRFRKKWLLAGIIVLLCFIGIQFIRPGITNPPVTADMAAPPEVKQILKRACYDCHSNETQLAWFDDIAPASWLVANHVKEGRKVLNFSNWDSLTKDQQKGKLFESLNQVVFKTMPLQQYTRFHPAANISEADIAVLRKYLTTLVPPAHASDSVKIQAAAAQFEKWIQAAPANNPVAAEHNGISFLPDYKNWEPISSSERFDNGTLRVILGNAVAMKAIREQHTNPWPDGAAFAKVAWEQLTDTAGQVRAGEFKQVEFMIKDSRQYASTDGWGWARWWKGTQLQPYGKNALFVTECMNCHQPMQQHDFVFTFPRNDSLPFKPFEWKVITSSVNKRDKTMSILYGNAVAVQYARTHADGAYPAGAALSLVTWNQQEDAHWFGANIPNTVRSVEQVRFSNAGSPSYEQYEGAALKKVAVNDAALAQTRIAYMTHQRASVMP